MERILVNSFADYVYDIENEPHHCVHPKVMTLTGTEEELGKCQRTKKPIPVTVKSYLYNSILILCTLIISQPTFDIHTSLVTLVSYFYAVIFTHTVHNYRLVTRVFIRKKTILICVRILEHSRICFNQSEIRHIMFISHITRLAMTAQENIYYLGHALRHTVDCSHLSCLASICLICAACAASKSLVSTSSCCLM